MKKNKDYSAREILDAYLFNAPLIIVAVVFIFIPVIGTIITSLYRDVTFLPEKFLSFENYKRLFTDLHFWQSVRFTLLFTLFLLHLNCSSG